MEQNTDIIKSKGDKVENLRIEVTADLPTTWDHRRSHLKNLAKHQALLAK